MDVLVVVLGVLAGVGLAVAVVGWQRAALGEREWRRGRERERAVRRAWSGLVG